jgi:hypothetical protein
MIKQEMKGRGQITSTIQMNKDKRKRRGQLGLGSVEYDEGASTLCTPT